MSQSLYSDLDMLPARLVGRQSGKTRQVSCHNCIQLLESDFPLFVTSRRDLGCDRPPSIENGLTTTLRLIVASSEPWLHLTTVFRRARSPRPQLIWQMAICLALFNFSWSLLERCSTQHTAKDTPDPFLFVESLTLLIVHQTVSTPRDDR